MRFSFVNKLILSVVTLFAIMLVLLVGNSVRLINTSHQDLLWRFTQEQSRLLATVLRPGLLYEDRALLNEALAFLKNVPEVKFAAVYNTNWVMMSVIGPAPKGRWTSDVFMDELPQDETINVHRIIDLEGLKLGYLHVGYSTERVQSITNRTLKQNSILAGLALALAVMLTVLLSLFLTRRLRRLTEGAAALKDGHLDYRIQLKANDELGDLAKVFNQMAESLEKTLLELRSEKLTLQKSEETLRRAQAIANLGRWEMDVVSGSLHWSEDQFRMYGLDPEKFHPTFESVMQYIRPEDRENMRKSVHEALYEAKPFNYEYRIARYDGEERYIVSLAKLYRDDKGDPVQLVGITQDITERKKAAEAIRKQNEFLSAVIESLTHPFIVVDVKDYTIKLANRFARQLSISDKHYCYNLFHDKNYPCDGKLGVCPLEEVVRTGSAIMVERIYLTPEGDTRAFEVYTYPVFDDSGKVNEIIEYCLDVTERKKAEIALRHSEASLEKAQLIAHIGSFEFELKSGKTSWSNGMSLICGLPTHAPLSLEFFNTIIHPEDRRVIEDCKRRILKEKKFSPFDFRILWSDGSVRYMHAEGELAFNEDGGINTVIGTVQDVTERTLAEADKNRLAKAINQAADAIIITDEKGAIQYINPSFERITGFNREEAIGQTPGILKSGRHPDSFYAALWERISAGETWNDQIINRKKDGSFITMKTTISPVFDSRGKITNFVGVEHDITQESMLSKAKDYFTAISSHELRTPLAKLQIVKLWFDKKKSIPPVDEEDAELLVTTEKVLDSTLSDFNRIVSATTMFSNLLLSRSAVRFHSVNLFLILQHCVMVAKEMADKENRDIDIAFDPGSMDINIKISCEQEMIQRAIQEILSNAVKYTPDGKKIRISGGTDDGWVSIVIADEGIGIPEETKSQIFEPFFSLENPSTHFTGQYKYMGGGIGMGLTLARLVMEYHNGIITVESPGMNMGTTVRLRFPKAVE